MARELFYLCKVCNKTYRSDKTAAMVVCEKDHDDMVRLRALYTRIVAKHRSLKAVPIGQVMARLWDWYEKQTGTTDPSPETVALIPIDELKDVF